VGERDPMRIDRTFPTIRYMGCLRDAATRLYCAVLLVGVLGAGVPRSGAAEAPLTLLRAAELQQRLAAERGQVVILNLWGTWCVPCLREIPDLMEVERRLAARGVRLIGLGMDEASQRDGLVLPFHRKHFPAFRSYLRNEPDMDTLVSVVDPAWNEILPTTYLIGRDGKVFKKIQGRRSIDEFIGMLEPALAPPLQR
jgi:thiol-disulfide isomerase/thioredoxin